ncbi:MAG: helix-turn-helix transcriptional regulator [Pseudomonadota bacterium]
MAHPIDHHVGQKLRQRRRLLGLTQQKLADAVNIRFQQIQKYESGANRISASRLWTLARALDVPVSYFFDGLNGLDHGEAANGAMPSSSYGMTPAGTRSDVFNQKETIDLVRAYYTLADEPRRRLLDLAKAMSGAA